MRIVFAGTPAFAAVSLDALLRSGHDVALVLTQPDRPAGRGLKAQPSAVHLFARERGLAVLQPASLKDAAVLQAVTAMRPEVLVVAAYGRILPASLLRAAPRGAINVHASLLPRWRGAAPLQRALLAGDAVTGATIMQMEEGLDTGPILLQASVAVAPEETAGTLHDKLAALGADLLVRALAETPTPRPQEESEVTYAHRITTDEAEIDWSRSAPEIDRQVRAYDPAPGARTQVNGVALKIWHARPEPETGGAPGTVRSADAAGIVVACGTGALRVLEVQRAGGKRLSAGAFLAGHKLAPGAVCGRAGG
jgi:methionyl-tRNA formyltransferase